MAAWRAAPIPAGTFSWEVALWLWEAGQRRCPLCGQLIDFELTERQHPAKAEVDHIVPRVAGSPHTWGNVRVTHSVCNRFRGGWLTPGWDWLPQQYLRAFGRAMERPQARNSAIATARHHLRALIDSPLRRIEFFEEALVRPDDPEATKWLSDALLESGPTAIREAVAVERRQMVMWQRELDRLDDLIATRRARRTVDPPDDFRRPASADARSDEPRRTES